MKAGRRASAPSAMPAATAAEEAAVWRRRGGGGSSTSVFKPHLDSPRPGGLISF